MIIYETLREAGASKQGELYDLLASFHVVAMTGLVDSTIRAGWED